MAEKTIDPDSAAASARALLEKSVEERVAAVRSLVAATNDVDAADQSAREARDAHSKAWDAALASGWSDKDLRATGARAPGDHIKRTRTKRTPKETTPATSHVTADASTHSE
ncbi:hypothetical protein [Rathayibacter sp. VKM Ac-2857]|uniref:hypothetical protein n=1 Tax=Rathayibacter sp. VKM Ac-2857 TaxID=2739020 RepID=UPI001564DCF7|nr:hypothetical protein [Rathayibacter sp. VKM Ac-2857]NQX18194.1 hypothetical protein [Rathayibacter sp. VKM Ac-2857]